MSAVSPALPQRIYLGDYAAGRDNNFNLLRLFAATLVLISHSFALSIGSPAAEPLRASLGTTWGTIAVDIFFVASGFLVTGSLLYRRDIVEFVAARALRILPALWTALALTVIAVGFLFTTLTPRAFFADLGTWKYLAKNAVLLKGIAYVLPGSFVDVPSKLAVNGSLWTLPLEVNMYLTLAAIWLVSRYTRMDRVRVLSMACLVLAATGLAMSVVYHLQGRTDHLISLGAMFFAGAALRVLQDRIVMSSLVAAGLLAAVLASAAVGAVPFGVVYRLAIPYLVLYFALVPAGAVRRFNVLGDYSYGMYIYAFPVQQATAFFWRGIGPYEMLGVSFAVTLAIAVLSWHLIEERALGMKRRFRRTQAA